MSTSDSAASPAAPLISLVDDQPEFRQWLLWPLLEAGFRVITASNGMKALDTVRREQPDFALIDVRMPRVDAFELLKALKDDLTTADIPAGIMPALPADHPIYCYQAISGRGEVYPPHQRELEVIKLLLDDPAGLALALCHWRAGRDAGGLK